MSISDDLSTSCPYCHELVRNYLHNGVVSGAARGPGPRPGALQSFGARWLQYQSRNGNRANGNHLDPSQSLRSSRKNRNSLTWVLVALTVCFTYPVLYRTSSGMPAQQRCDSFTYDGDPPPMLLMRAYFYSHSNGGRRECAGTGTQSLRTALGALIGGEIPLKRLARTRASRSVQR